jgi:N-acetylglutamate synthase-like GNAT family acetyltransferase
MMIRICSDHDFEEVFEIINDAAKAYKGVIPTDCWHEPYMWREQLRWEIDDGVVFWVYQEEKDLIGVMGIQDKNEVTLIRHAYVRTSRRNQGIGARLLRFLESATDKPILIGTWAAAAWAVAFYQKNGYRLVSEEEKNHLLRKYWTISDRQVETSVVLADTKWTNCHIRPGDEL